MSQSHPTKTAKLGIAAGLAQATSALLGAGNAYAGDKSWDIDTAVLYYSEKDRVSAVEPVISATKTLSDERYWNLKLVVDSLTGATPNGAAPTDNVQTFTTPSGAATYQTAAGETPKESNFHENARVAISTQYTTPINDTLKASGGLAFSREYDYLSLGFNANIAKDFNQHNTTLSFGLAYANDTVEPVGGKPIAGAPMTGVDDSSSKDGSDDTKTVTDLLFGLTQVINPKWLMQFNYSLSQQSGYLTDPYKVISLLDDNGEPSLSDPSNPFSSYIYEARPDERTKHSLYLRSKSHHGKDNVLDLSYRYHTDDWGIDSHTFDAKFRWQLNDHHYLTPHIRYYQQAEADFYTQGLSAGSDLPEFASADPRLAKFTGLTVGAQYGYLFGDDKEINFRLESYTHDGDDQALPGGLDQRQEIFPALDAVIVQIGYSFKF